MINLRVHVRSNFISFRESSWQHLTAISFQIFFLDVLALSQLYYLPISEDSVIPSFSQLLAQNYIQALASAVVKIDR